MEVFRIFPNQGVRVNQDSFYPINRVMRVTRSTFLLLVVAVGPVDVVVPRRAQGQMLIRMRAVEELVETARVVTISPAVLALMVK
jgi:hypothetical protein